ncbi:MAG TPA: hypothetical protein VIL37_05530 [Natronosporangium sp.]
MGLATRRTSVVTIAALLTIISLGFLAWHRLSAEPAVIGTSAELAGMTTEVQAAGWVGFDMGHVMNGQGGFMMPSQMMPDAPSGDEVRLGVTVTLVNTNDGTQEFNILDEFAIVGGLETEPQPVSADTIGELSRLGPGAAIDGTLYFDVEIPSPDDPPLQLQWTRDGETVLIEVPLTEEDAPAHEHG